MVSVGALGPFFWKDAAPYLAIPTSVFAMVLLPIAHGKVDIYLQKQNGSMYQEVELKAKNMNIVGVTVLPM